MAGNHTQGASSVVKQPTKRERIEFLLEHWTDFWETMERSETMRDDPGGSVTLMPGMSRHPSVVELARSIAKARQVMPVKTAHLMAFYTAEWRNTNVQERRKTKKGRIEMVDARVRQRIVPKWVRASKVEAALVYVVLAFNGEVFVPDELLEVAAA